MSQLGVRNNSFDEAREFAKQYGVTGTDDLVRKRMRRAGGLAKLKTLEAPAVRMLLGVSQKVKTAEAE